MLFVIPGCMLRDYTPVTKHFSESKVVDIWPKEAAGLRSIGSPGVETYERWMLEAARKCDSIALANPDSIFLCHSAGADVVRHMKEHPKMVVALGCRPVDGAFHLVGWMDTLCHGYVGDDTISVPGGHFNCVGEHDMTKCQAIQCMLGYPCIQEVYLNAGLEIANVIKGLFQNLPVTSKKPYDPVDVLLDNSNHIHTTNDGMRSQLKSTR